MKSLIFVLFLLPASVFGQVTLEKANQLLQDKKFAKARTAFSEIIKNAPESFEAFFGRAECSNGLGDFSASIEDYTQAIHLKADFEKAILHRAGAYFQLSIYEKAIEDYSQLIELNYHDMGLIYFLRGLSKTLLPQQDVDGACSDLRKAKELGFDTGKLPGINKYCNATDLE